DEPGAPPTAAAARLLGDERRRGPGRGADPVVERRQRLGDVPAPGQALRPGSGQRDPLARAAALPGRSVRPAAGLLVRRLGGGAGRSPHGPAPAGPARAVRAALRTAAVPPATLRPHLPSARLAGPGRGAGPRSGAAAPRGRRAGAGGDELGDSRRGRLLLRGP